MDIHLLEFWTSNKVMEQNLMEGSFQRQGLFTLVLRVWDLTFVPGGAFGIDIHLLESWNQIKSWSKISWRALFEARLFISGSKSLGLDIWPRWSIWDGLHLQEAWTQNRVMEQNLMEGSFQRQGLITLVLRGWDLTFGPRGASTCQNLGHQIKSWSKISWRAHFRGQAFSLSF